MEKEEIPIDWKMGIMCPIYKKGDRNKCNNYRGIMLWSCMYKVTDGQNVQRK